MTEEGKKGPSRRFFKSYGGFLGMWLSMNQGKSQFFKATKITDQNILEALKK